MLCPSSEFVGDLIQSLLEHIPAFSVHDCSNIKTAKYEHGEVARSHHDDIVFLDSTNACIELTGHVRKKAGCFIAISADVRLRFNNIHLRLSVNTRTLQIIDVRVCESGKMQCWIRNSGLGGAVEGVIETVVQMCRDEIVSHINGCAVHQ